jgi:uncharacterized protein
MSAIRIIVFAKAPFPGLAKTRLAPVLGAEGAARLAGRMLAVTLDAALAAAVGPVELCTEPQPHAREWRGTPMPAGVEVSAQGEGDLGARLARAAQRTLERGEAVLLIGADSPDLSAELLRAASRALREFGSVIFGAADGGYVLLGLTRFSAELFRDMPWSTEVVAAETLRRFAALDWPVHVGPVCHDVDVPRDLEHVPGEWLEENDA